MIYHNNQSFQVYMYTYMLILDTRRWFIPHTGVTDEPTSCIQGLFLMVCTLSSIALNVAGCRIEGNYPATFNVIELMVHYSTHHLPTKTTCRGEWGTLNTFSDFLSFLQKYLC